MIPFIDLKKEYTELKDEIGVAISGVLESGQFISGKMCRIFEEDFARYCQTKYCVGTNSGTAALFLALKAINIQQGDEVITTPFSFAGTSQVIVQLNAKPVFVDVKDDTFNIDESLIEENITDKTKAILPVHIFGNPPNMNKINNIADNYGLKVIEDACQAHGTTYKEKKAGNLGDLGCFSFYPTKNIGAYGDAGCITTNNEEYASNIKVLRNQGETTKYVHEKIGFNERLDELQAAILNVKLRCIDEWTKKRRKFAELYKKSIPFILQKEESEGEHSYHQFTIKVNNRGEIVEKLKELGITTAIHYPKAIHEQPAYRKWAKPLPNAERLAKEVLSLPIHHSLQEEHILKVIEKLNKL